MKRFFVSALLVLLLCLICTGACAGSNEVIVATDGDGITVYTASTGSKKAGLLYNGFSEGISLEPEHGRYSCRLTSDYTVWLNLDKAQKYLPDGWYESNSLGDSLACSVFLGEVTVQDAAMYSAPDHKCLSARHAQGTLVLVCGEFGNDYLVSLGVGYGFMPKSAIRSVQPCTYDETLSDTWGVEGAQSGTIYTDGRKLMHGGSATGYSDANVWRVLRNGDQVTILATLGDWVQLAGGGFIERRYLDPDADHSPVYATVRTTHVLNRLIVRAEPNKDARILCKLCSGTRVQVINHTDDWAFIVLQGDESGQMESGLVQMKYLVFGSEQVDDGSVRVRTTRELYGWNRSSYGYVRSSGGYALPAGTVLTVTGVNGNSGANAELDWFICRTEDGRLIHIGNDDALEVIDPAGIVVKTSSKVNLRAAPSKSSASLASLAKGTTVKVLLRGEIWSIVTYGETTGYVMSRYLKFP